MKLLKSLCCLVNLTKKYSISNNIKFELVSVSKLNSKDQVIGHHEIILAWHMS